MFEGRDSRSLRALFATMRPREFIGSWWTAHRSVPSRFFAEPAREMIPADARSETRCRPENSDDFANVAFMLELGSARVPRRMSSLLASEPLGYHRRNPDELRVDDYRHRCPSLLSKSYSGCTPVFSASWTRCPIVAPGRCEINGARSGSQRVCGCDVRRTPG